MYSLDALCFLKPLRNRPNHFTSSPCIYLAHMFHMKHGRGSKPLSVASHSWANRNLQTLGVGSLEPQTLLVSPSGAWHPTGPAISCGCGQSCLRSRSRCLRSLAMRCSKSGNAVDLHVWEQKIAVKTRQPSFSIFSNSQKNGLNNKCAMVKT